MYPEIRLDKVNVNSERRGIQFRMRNLFVLKYVAVSGISNKSDIFILNIINVRSIV